MADDLFFACRCGLPECEPCLANAEIERLRAELNAWRRAVSGTERLLDRARAESESLRQDRDRLQALIDALAALPHLEVGTDDWWQAIDALLAAATKEDDRG